MTTAMAPTTVSSPSCWRWGRSDEITWSATPMAMQMATAMTTPIHTWRRASRRPCWARNPATMPDDEGRLHPLSQPDDERRKHPIPCLDLGAPNS